MLIRRVEIAGRGPFDVRIIGERIAEIAARIERAPGEPEIDGAGGCLLPGLHDHHVHLLALVAAQSSVHCGPPQVRTLADLQRTLRDQPAAGGDGWLRGVGYHESVAGVLDRHALDRLVPDRPLRIQHRGGAMWFFNSAACRLLGLDGRNTPSGVERDNEGRATGRMFRCDDWLREHILSDSMPSLADTSRRLASFGVTGMTDATATNGAAELDALVRAVDCGEIAQSLYVMGSDALPSKHEARIRSAHLKVLLDDTALPGLDELTEQVSHAHAHGRAVAFHCVTRTQAVLACAALDAIRTRDERRVKAHLEACAHTGGSRPGDRIEHAAIVTPDIANLLRAVDATVVTQPNFIRERGDRYLEDVEEEDRAWLYRCAGLLHAGIPVGGGTDAPFGDADPWLAIRAAVTRNTYDGNVLGENERISPERALALFTTDAETPGGPPRTVRRGSIADVCLLDRPWLQAREALTSGMVTATICRGALAWLRPKA